jgi:hypothetical protein
VYYVAHLAHPMDGYARGNASDGCILDRSDGTNKIVGGSF